MSHLISYLFDHLIRYKKIIMSGVIALYVLYVIALSGFCVISGINFYRNCEVYLKTAADASTVKIAETELQRAVSYIEKKGLTKGYTSIFFETQDENVGFWYKNIKAALVELKTLNSETTPLEASSVLIKIRETLLDHTGSGEEVTIPLGISIYPYNGFVAFGIFISLIFGVISVWLFFIERQRGGFDEQY